MLPFVDDECEIIDSEILEVMAKRDVNLFEDEADNTKSMLARQYRLALWTMYKRIGFEFRSPNLLTDSFRLIRMSVRPIPLYACLNFNSWCIKNPLKDSLK